MLTKTLAPRLALAWSITYAVLGIYWAAGGSAFPFGAADSRAVNMGSLLAAATPEATGVITAVIGLAGAVIAPVLSRSPGVRSSAARTGALGFAWCTSALLTLVVPDGRVLVQLAYALMGNFRGLDWTVANQLICIVGGVAWGLTAIGFHRAITAPNSKTAGRSVPAWGPAVTYAAVALPLVYAATRLAWALGLTIGFGDGAYLAEPQRRTTELTLAAMAVAGSLLTTGLVSRWGQVFPGWTPLLSGRRVPPVLAIIPAGIVATALTVGGLMLWRGLLAWLLGVLPDSDVFDTANWAAWLGNLTFLPWGVTLAAATYAYHRRARAAQLSCPRPRPSSPAAGRRRGSSAPRTS
jgi:hypothetical protein